MLEGTTVFKIETDRERNKCFRLRFLLFSTDPRHFIQKLRSQLIVDNQYYFFLTWIHNL